MTEYERVREQALLTDEEINTALKDYTHYFYDSQGGRYEGNWAVLKIALETQRDKALKTDGIEIRADSQDLNESSHFIWTQTTQSKEEMSRYQTGEIDKDEHTRQRRQIIDEELAIYYKAQQDMLKAGFIKVIPKEEYGS